MPQRKQLTWTELRVGLFVLVAIFVLVVAIFYVTGAGVLGPKYRLVTYLPETDGLAVGAPVRLDGVEAGNVDAIQMNSTPPLTPARSIKLTLRIDKKYQNEIRTDSSAGLITEGLLGNRYVSIQRGFTGQPLQPNQEIPGREERAIKQIVERGAFLDDALGQGEDSDEAALFGDRLDLIVRQIARVVQHAAGVGVAHDQRRFGRFQRLEKSLAVHVREIDHHSEAVHLLDDFDAEAREPSLGAVFPHAVAQLVAEVPGELHRAQAEAIEISELVDAAAKRHAPFEMEDE